MPNNEITIIDGDRSISVVQAQDQNQVITMWLHGRPRTTQRAYSYEVKGLLAMVEKPLRYITLGDLQNYFSSLAVLAPASQARAMLSSPSSAV